MHGVACPVLNLSRNGPLSGARAHCEYMCKKVPATTKNAQFRERFWLRKTIQYCRTNKVT